MKKSLSLLMAAFTAFAVDAYADKGFTTMQENTQGVAVSPNGRYLIGVDPTVKANGYMKSFIYDLSTDGLQWITEYDENDMTKGGEFVKVNDDGTVCGNAMDPDHMITYSDWAGTVVTPAMSAAVWKDGKRTLLGYGDFDLAELKNSGDGSFATGISADGKKVVGYFSTSSSAYVKSCVWTEDGGEWTLSWLPIPEDGKWSYAKAVSTDGNTIAGTVTMNDNTGNGIVWKDGGYTLITKDMLGVEESWGQMKFNAMSPNGRYVVLTLSGNGTFVYDTEKGECKTIPLLDSEGSMGEVAIDNDGNAVSSLQFGSIFFGGDVYTIPFWYSYEEGRSLAMDYYMSVVAEGVEPDFPMSAEDKTQVVPIAVSADGNVIVGNADTYVALGQTPKCWILEIEKDGLQIPATPGGLKAESNTLNYVRLTWDKDTNAYDGLTLKSYNVYRDGELTAQVDASAPAMEIIQEDVPAGHPLYEVEAVFAKDGGGTMLSPKSEALKVAVLGTYAMPLFEDFESGSLDENYWTTTCEYGDEDNARWNVSGGYGYSGNGVGSSTYDGEPYSTSLVSRPLDATKEETVTMSFLAAYTFINIPDQDLSNDTVSVEVSTDGGETWTEQQSWTVIELCPGTHFTIRSVDLTEAVAGKMFKLRLRKHGKGTASFYVNFDNIKIGSTPEREAPTGLIGMFGDGNESATIAWQNPSQAYQLNYINEPTSNKYTIGNEGKEMIAANSFSPADLTLYKGKYLTGVSTMINHYSYVETVKGIHASVVVFEDDKLVCEQEIEEMPYNEDFTVILDQPVMINADKELKIGIKIFDYDAEEIPLIYAQSPLFIAGKSDLYSEDGGTTWKNVSDFYEPDEERGQCCWYITGCVTDDPEPTLTDEEAPLSYIVFRDGVQLNQEQMDKLQTRFTDNAPERNACYEVIAIYMNGDRSENSEQLCMDIPTGISRFVTDGTRITMSAEDGRISIEGDYDSASLTTVGGVCVAKTSGNGIPTGGLADGVYLLCIEKDGNIQTHKILIRR